ncbi:MAG: hypothetical protein Q8868_07300 [Bacteroidota bacterium]|nr:hypothetical protein [Bacteroidota bacterium]
MKILIPVFLLSFFPEICSPQTSDQKLENIFRRTYLSYIISKGDNRPDFDRKKDNIDRFLVALFKGVPVGDFMKKAGWTRDMLDEKVRLLTEKGWLKRDGDKLCPTVFIASEEEGKELYKYAGPLAVAIAESIAGSVPSIKEKFKELKLDPPCSFEDLSFLILSDVLLDNWQLMKMESAFLKQENRPERHGKFYYASIEESSETGYEPFGIYGNQSGRINDSTWLNIYGNNRITANRDLANKQFCDSVMAHSLILTTEIYNFFEEISDDYHPKLMKILEDNREYSMSVFRKTGYADQIKFEEFFIWWYHFIYTSATNILAEKGLIKIPPGSNFYYR